jgi:hypothetical protein
MYPIILILVWLLRWCSHLVTGDEGHYAGVVSEMEARGAKVRRGSLVVHHHSPMPWVLRLLNSTGSTWMVIGILINVNVQALQVVPVFAGGLDFSLPVKKFFYDPLGSGKSFVGCVVSLTGFALVGGPARQDAPKVCASQCILMEHGGCWCCSVCPGVTLHFAILYETRFAQELIMHAWRRGVPLLWLHFSLSFPTPPGLLFAGCRGTA